MNKNKRRPYTLYSLVAPLLVLAVIAGVYIYKNNFSNTTETESVLSASNKSNKSTKNKENNAAEHRNTVETVVETLNEVSNKVKGQGRPEVSEALEEITSEIEDQAEDTTEAIEELDSLPKWKEFLVGAGYDNLGKLRSSLAHNTNTIRKMTREMESLGPGETSEALQAQLTLMNQERERIQNVLTEHEEQFSLLGWVAKLFSGKTYDVGLTPESVPETTESTGVTE